MKDIRVYVLNLDRHEDRLAHVSNALLGQSLDWQRFPAIDGSKVGDAALDEIIERTGPIPRMTRAARACTASQIQIMRRFLETEADYALILEDDVELVEDFGERVREVLSATDFDILNLNRQPTRSPKKRIFVRRKEILKVGDMVIHDLVGVHYGAAGYCVGRSAAQSIIDLYGHPNMPIDHILFNPNVSKLFGRIRIQQLFPALVRPRAGLVSSIQNEPVAEARMMRRKIQRAWTEVAIAPRLLLGTALGFYQVKVLEFGTAGVANSAELYQNRKLP